MSATSYTYRGDAPAVAGEPRYTTSLVGMDGKPRTTTVAGKKAENEFLAWGRAIADVHRADVQRREASFAAHQTRLRTARELTCAQEAERDAIERERRRDEKEAERINKEMLSGQVTVAVYQDLGPVWTRRWLKEELGEQVPEIVFADLNTALTCTALRRGVDALKERRQRRQTVRDPVALVVDVASRWQKSRPIMRLPVEEAMQLPPERIAPSR